MRTSRPAVTVWTMERAADVPDVFDPRVYAEGVPHERYRTLRDRHPVAWQAEPEMVRARLLGRRAGRGFRTYGRD